MESKKLERRYSMKKRLGTAAVSIIPKKVKLFDINFCPEYDYPMPFYWAGYSLQTRYSFWLDHLKDEKEMLRNFNDRTRTYLNKAQKSGLIAKQVSEISAIIALSKEKDAFAYDYEMLSRLWSAMQKNGVGRAIEIRDENDRLHAGLAYHISKDRQIHLFSTKDPELGNLGGMTLAIWHSIQQATSEIRFHDFEGSMLEPVEKFFRGFGTYPKPYLQIRKNSFPPPFKWFF